jgi:hypothetical protein
MPMILNLNPNNNRVRYFNGKRFFVIVLFINTFLGCIYYIHEQKEQVIVRNPKPTKILNNTFNQEKYNQYLIKPNKAIKFIQNILENEYNQDDLIKFYNHVQKEYSLGLKCTRKRNRSQAIDRFSLTNWINSNITIINTADR